jgi:enoyl-CoA hydratase/carnithine racemase
MGLVNQVVPLSELLGAARELARKIAQGPPISVQLAKQLLYQGLHSDLKTQLRQEALAGNLPEHPGSRRSRESLFGKKKPCFYR